MRVKNEITATANHSTRTFTIRKNGSKYRTYRQTKDDFNSLLNNTYNDWQDFLKYSQDYFIVK